MDNYITEFGDTLESVAEKLGVNESDLIKLNNLLPPYILQENQVLNIPLYHNNTFNYYKVKKGDTIYAISKRYGVDPDIVEQINGLEKDEYIYPDQILLIPKNDVSTYITKEGDTIDVVASYFNTYPNNILMSNNDLYLAPGQLIAYKNQ